MNRLALNLPELPAGHQWRIEWNRVVVERRVKNNIFEMITELRRTDWVIAAMQFWSPEPGIDEQTWIRETESVAKQLLARVEREDLKQQILQRHGGIR